MKKHRVESDHNTGQPFRNFLGVKNSPPLFPVLDTTVLPQFISIDINVIEQTNAMIFAFVILCRILDIFEDRLQSHISKIAEKFRRKKLVLPLLLILTPRL